MTIVSTDGAAAGGSGGPAQAFVSGQVAAAARGHDAWQVTNAADAEAPDEWRQVAQLPDSWRPLPALEVQTPLGTSEPELRKAITAPIDAAGLRITAIHFEPLPSAISRRVGIVRFEPPPLPWLVHIDSDAEKRGEAPVENGGAINSRRNNVSGSVLGVADKALQAVAAAKVAIRGERLLMHAGFRMCATWFFIDRRAALHALLLNVLL